MRSVIWEIIWGDFSRNQSAWRRRFGHSCRTPSFGNRLKSRPAWSIYSINLGGALHLRQQSEFPPVG